MALVGPVRRIFTGRTTGVGRGRTEDGRDLVVKQLIGPHPTAEAIARLRREFETTRIAAGEGVVRAPELLETDGLPVIVEEDIGGESLAHHLDSSPLGLRDALRLGLGVARALARVHRAGVIHKDLNPANIAWNRATGAIKLIDFGLSSRLSWESPSLASPARLDGTLACIAPEQTGRMNGPIDTRADLDSLGVTLYELLAGERSFEVRDALEFVRAHVALSPRPLADVAPAVPGPVDDVVMRLLGKAAEDRCQSAAGLAEDLATCLQQLEDAGAVEPFELGTRDVLQRLRIPGRLHGRDPEREALFEAFDEAFDEALGGALEVVLVSGYSGVGKTSLIHELVRPVVQARGSFVSGKFEQFNRGRPYASLLQALGGFVRQLLSEQEDVIAAWRDRLLLGLQGDGRVLTEVLPELGLVVGEQPAVVELPPTEAANRFQIVFGRFVRSLAGPAHPLVLFLDFGRQLLEVLHRDELLWFAAAAQTWAWDVDEISARDVTDDVVDFRAGRLRALPEATVQALSRAAFVGTGFDLAAVAPVLGRSTPVIAAALGAALDDELIDATDPFAGQLRFVHDRVQQAAYSLFEPADRPAIQLEVGRILLERFERGELGLFEVVHAMNAGRAQISDPAERARLRQLDLEAGRRALAAAAYEPARGSLEAGLELLDESPWASDYEQTLKLHLEAASAACPSHQRDAMAELVRAVLAHGRAEVDKVRAYEVEIYALFADGEPGPTLDLGLAVLAMLGVELRGEPAQDNVVAALVATQGALAAFGREGLMALPLDEAELSLAVARFLNTLTSPARFARPALLPLLAFELVQNALQHGLAPGSQDGFATYGLVLRSIGTLPGGIEAGESAVAMRERLPNPRLVNLTRHVYLAHTRFWNHRWGSLRGPKREVFRGGRDLGDLLFACFSPQMAGTAGLFAQHELGPLLADMKASERAVAGLGQAIPLQLQVLNLGLALALHEGAEDPDVFTCFCFDERVRVPELEAAGDASNLYVFGVLKTMQCLLLGDAPAAANAAEATQAWLAGAASSLHQPMYVWAGSMAQLRAFHRLPEDRQEAVRARVEANRAALAGWAQLGPMNLDHRLTLVNAEWARVFGGDQPAAQLHPAAIAQAADGGWIGDQALGNELAGDPRDLAGDQAQRAGRDAPAHRPGVLGRPQRRPDPGRRGPAAGALRGHRRDRHHGARRRRSSPAMGGAAPAACSAPCSAPARRSRWPTPRSTGPSAGVPYVQQHRVRSVLCVPLEHQGRLVAMLYLEKGETAAVFTEQRTELLRVIGVRDRAPRRAAAAGRRRDDEACPAHSRRRGGARR